MWRRREGSEIVVGGAGGQVWVTGPSGTTVELFDATGASRRGAVDEFGERLAGLGVTHQLRGQGGLVFRDVAPGRHQVRIDGRSSDVEVLPDDVVPDDHGRRVVGQALEPGFGYVETRDGTLLSRNIVLPDPADWGPGPYATIVQCSAYADSRPDALTGDPELDDGMTTELNVARLLGFAVVGVNARGTGASGGSFRMFDRIHGLDGYDVVEALAAQPWCDGVGMIGASGPGFMQLRIAATAPPSLGAVTPAAVLARSFGTGRRPGGLVNSWVTSTLAGWSVDALTGLPPDAHAPRYDAEGWDGWVVERIRTGGDPTAVANQLLRGQNIAPTSDFVDHLDDASEARTAPRTWASTVRCPVLLIGSWQDQESGPGWVELLDDLPGDTEVSLLGTNGTHEETRFPESVARWAGFLSERLRGAPLTVTEAAERYLQGAAAGHLGATTLPIAPLGSVGAGRALLRVENGAGPGGPGQPTASGVLDVGLDVWPPAGTEVRRALLDPAGALLLDATTAAAGVSTYRYDPSIRPPSSGGRPGFDVNAPDPDYDWRPLPVGFGLRFVTAPMTTDVLLCGPVSVDLWVRCSAPDVDLEVTLTEVRPDGWETFVQSGWLRAGLRHLDPARSSELRPEPTYRAEDEAPLAADAFVLARIPVSTVVHRLRPGSRLALLVEPPGGVQPTWTFDALWPDGRCDGEPVVVDIGTGPDHPSSMALPLLAVDGRLPATPRPPPGALRRQPSRRVV